MKLYLLLVILAINIPVFSYQWPSNKDYLKTLFGAPLNNTIQDGIVFSSDGQAIYPLTDGEIIFYQESFEFGDNTYFGNEGNVLALKHVGEFKSIYRNFNSTDNFSSVEILYKTEMIGVSSNKNDDFIFSVYDDKKDAYINPQQILPFLSDDKKPVINSVYINNNDIQYKLSHNKVLPPGKSLILIDAWDIVQVKNLFVKFTPFSVNVFVDGFERFNISFSSLVEKENVIYISGETDIPVVDFLSTGKLIYGGEVFFTTGKSLIEVVIKDINGNEVAKSFPVIIE